MSRPWFKLYGRDYRDGVRDLPWDVTGIYSVLLTYMYEEENGRIKDHDQRLARLVGCDIRLWKRARAALIEAGKLTLTDGGFLVNGRVEVEVRAAQHVSEVRAKSATSSAQVRHKFGRSSPQLTVSDTLKPRKINDPPEAFASDLPLYARASPESESESEIASLRSAIPPKAVKATRRSAVASDLNMTEPARAFAAERGFMNGNAEALWERFTAHHAAKGTLFANVDAGWRTWVLNEIKFQGERHDQPARATGGGSRPRSAVEAILSDIGRQPHK